MPSTKSKDQKEAALGRKVHRFRQTKKGNNPKSTHHPEVEKAGIDAGLPTNWMDSEDFTPEIRLQKAIEGAKLIAAFYNDPKNKRMPSWHSKDQIEHKLGKKLSDLKQGKKGRGGFVYYPEAEKAGIDAGLPTNWMDTKST